MIPYMVAKLVPNSTHFTRVLVEYAQARRVFVPSLPKVGDKL